MPFADGTFDTLVVADTLEHVPDDRLALAECRRVLRPQGMAVFTVPQSDNGHTTYEDPSINTAALREHEYGQWDHVRNYGEDFSDRIADAGFRVTCVDQSAFDPGFAARHVLVPPIPLDMSWGWNRRRVYFAEHTGDGGRQVFRSADPQSSGSAVSGPIRNARQIAGGERQADEHETGEEHDVADRLHADVGRP